MRRRGLVQRLLGLAVSLGLVGCAVSDPTQYYTLGQAAGGIAGSTTSASPRGNAAEAGSLGIGVGPVILPGYLARNQIVIRTGTDQVELSTYHRWAEPLEDGIARILAEEISARVPTERIVTFPWRGVVARTLQYQVVVAVLRFDGRQGGDVTLDTRWRILARDGKELAFRRSTMIEATGRSGYEPMVAAMVRALGSLGREIATEIRALPR